MATRITVILQDDLDGGKADESVVFGVDGAAYEIDLSNKHAAALRKALAPFVNAGRKAGRAHPSGNRVIRSPAAGRASIETAEIRSWAIATGYEVGSRGRIPSLVREAYTSR